MPRDRQRLTLESGPVLDLAEIIRRGSGRAGARIRAVYSFSKGEVLATELSLDEHGGTMELAFDGRRQSFKLTCRPRHFGGSQWYIVCPSTSRRVRVLYRPLGAPWFASRHAWGRRRAAYASQFLGPVDRAWRTKAKVKARLIGDADPDEWDLPPKPKWMRLSTYARWEAKYDEAEDILEEQCAFAVARFMKRKP
jgi:hypothetical protein